MSCSGMRCAMPGLSVANGWAFLRRFPREAASVRMVRLSGHPSRCRRPGFCDRFSRHYRRFFAETD